MADVPVPTDPNYKDRLKRAVQPIFEAYILPLNVLTAFHAYNEKVLTQRDIDRVKAVTESKGTHDGATELLDRLVRYDGWFPCLMEVLRDRNVKLDHVANKMEEEKDKLDGTIEEEKKTKTEQLQDALKEKDQQMLEQRAFIATLHKEKIELQKQLGIREIRLEELCEQLTKIEVKHAAVVNKLTDEIKSLKKSHSELIEESDKQRAIHASELESLKNDQDQKDDSSAQAENERLKQQLEEQDALIAKLFSGKAQLIQAVRSTSTLKSRKIWVAHLIKRGHHHGLNFLMESDIDIDLEVENGITALSFAASIGKTECLQCLIRKGADVNKKNTLDETALFFASARGYAACVEALLIAGADKEVTEKNRGRTPLIAAVKHHKCVQMLMEAGCDINRTDTSGKTALLYAAEVGNYESIQAFLGAGADPNHQDNRQNTPVIYASRSGNAQCLKALLNARASPNVQCRGETPLINAAKRGDFECVCLLLESGANPNTQDKQWDTPLIHAAREGHSDCAQLLLSAGAKYEIRNWNGKTAQDLAKNAEIREVFTILFLFYLDRMRSAIEDGFLCHRPLDDIT